ncbi:MAG: hypothetical protein SFV81_28750 [Pirellulaceae bacterium]|nr:hypothetical protein [Pirellulaceae bacterium]
MSNQRIKHRCRRRAAAAVELLFVFTTTVVAFYIMFHLGRWIIEMYFHDGNIATASPML